MLDVSKLSMWKTTLFMICICGLIALYYRYLEPMKGESKHMMLLKQLLYVVILTGVISIFTSTNDRDLKIMLLVIIIGVTNLYNINFSTRKCENLPGLRRIKLYLRSTVIIIILSLITSYSNFNDVLTFLYDTSEAGGGTKDSEISLDGPIGGAVLPSYCPSTTEMDKPEDSRDTWSDLSEKQKKNCTFTYNSIQRRNEIKL